MPPWICPSTIAWLMMRPMSSQLASARERDLAGLGVDLHLGHLRAVRPRRRRRRLRRGDADHLGGLARGQLGEGNRAVGARDAQAAVAELDVRGRSLERFGGQLLALGNDLPCPAATTADPPTNAEREPTLPTPFARSVSPWTILTLSEAIPKTSVDELRIRRLQPLPHRLGAREHRHRASRVDLDIHRLGGQRAGPFQVDRNAAAAQLAAA